MATQRIDARQLIDANRFGSYQIGVFLLCFLAMTIDGYDVQVVSCLCFGVFSLATAFATTVPELVVLRVLAGIGLGSTGPAALAISSEYAPRRIKASIPTWIWAAVPVGGMIGGALVAPMLGGILLQMHWTPSAMCYLTGAPMLLGTVALMLLERQPQFRHGPAVAAVVGGAAPQPSV
jgi:MFS family permease